MSAISPAGSDELPIIEEPRGSLLADSGPGFTVHERDEADDELPPIFEPAVYETTPEVVTPSEPAVDDEPDLPAPGSQEPPVEELSTTEPLPETPPVEEPSEAVAEVAPVVDEPAPAVVEPQAEAVEPEPVADVAPVKRYRTFNLINPNRLWVMVVAIFLLGGILAASLGASFTSVYAMAAWIGLPQAVQWLPVVILDVAIIGYSWALLVFSSRARDGRPTVFDGLPGLPGQPGSSLTAREARKLRERTWSTRMALTAVTLMSVAANFMHTYDFWHGNISTPQAILGAVYSSAIPIMALFATEELIRLVFVRRKQVYGGEAA